MRQSTSTRAAGSGPAARVGALAAAVALTLSLAACSGSTPTGPDANQPLGSSSEGTAAVPPRVTATPTPSSTTGTSDPAGTNGAGGADAASSSDDYEMPPPIVDAQTATGPAGDDAYDPDPRIAIVQHWAEEYARAATDSDPDRQAWLDTMTPKAQDDRMTMMGPDVGWTYPGPLPLTVTQVVTQDGIDKVETCMMVAGFAMDPATGAPSGQILLQGIEFHLAGDEARGYRVDGVFAGGNECDTVQVEGQAW